MKAPLFSPSRGTLNNYAIFYAKPSRKTLNKFGKPSTTLIIPGFARLLLSLITFQLLSNFRFTLYHGLPRTATASYGRSSIWSFSKASPDGL